MWCSLHFNKEEKLEWGFDLSTSNGRVRKKQLRIHRIDYCTVEAAQSDHTKSYIIKRMISIIDDFYSVN
jgi:hypothetical protein